MFREKFFPNFIVSAKNRYSANADTDVYGQESELIEEISRLCAAKPLMYIDTCTLLHKNASALLDAFETAARQMNVELLVPASVLYELENVGNKDVKHHEQGLRMIERITSMEGKRVVRVVLTNSPKFTDAGLISRFVSECGNNDIVLFTQDNELAKKVQQLPSFLEGCVNSNHQIKAYKLTATGNLIRHESERKVLYYEDTNVFFKQQQSKQRQQQTAVPTCIFPKLQFK